MLHALLKTIYKVREYEVLFVLVLLCLNDTESLESSQYKKFLYVHLSTTDKVLNWTFEGLLKLILIFIYLIIMQLLSA